MTLIIGIRCDEGIVMAADSAATMGSVAGQTAQLRTAKKLTICQGKIVVGISGFLGLGQRLVAAIDQGHKENKFKGRKETAVGAMRDALVKIAEPEWRMSGLVSQAQNHRGANSYATAPMLLALPIEKELVLVQFTETCAPEIATDELPFVALGSGQPLADPFLAYIRRVLWPKSALPSVADGVFSAMWTLTHTIETNPGGVAGPIQIVVLRNANGAPVATELLDSDLAEHREALDDLDRRIAEWRAGFTNKPLGGEPASPPA